MVKCNAKMLLALLAFFCVPCFSISVYKGIQPGKSTRQDVIAAFGQPVNNISASIFEYAMPPSQGKLFVEYRGDTQIVDRIERYFAKPVSRAAMIKSLNLPDAPEEKETTKDGRLVEYFGGLKVVSLTYVLGDVSSGVRSLNYLSFEMYDKLLNRAQNPTAQYDPTACRDLYIWSQTEREVAKRSKDVGRHQAVLEIQIVSQRGDCDKARKLVTAYRERYR